MAGETEIPHPKFSLDTSAFIDAWERFYAPDVFPVVWERMDELVDAGVIVASIEVMREMEKKSEGVVTWGKSHKSCFIETSNEILLIVREIMADFPEGFVDHRRGRSGADPFVIAVARVFDCGVVTAEGPGKKNTIKIPDVCRHYSIRCVGILEMFRQLRVEFR